MGPKDLSEGCHGLLESIIKGLVVEALLQRLSRRYDGAIIELAIQCRI